MLATGKDTSGAARTTDTNAAFANGWQYGVSVGLGQQLGNVSEILELVKLRLAFFCGSGRSAHTATHSAANGATT